MNSSILSTYSFPTQDTGFSYFRRSGDPLAEVADGRVPIVMTLTMLHVSNLDLKECHGPLEDNNRLY